MRRSLAPTTLLLIIALASAALQPPPRVQTRRAALSSAAAALLLPRPASAKRDESQWGPFVGMSTAKMDELDDASQDPFAGRLLPSGVRVIDLIEGDGAEAQKGKHVYVAYKVWARGFRAGEVADWSYMDGRPYDWVVGTPQGRLPRGVDEGIVGMKEGGWRRLVIPDAFGSAGLRRQTPARGGGRNQPPYAGYVILPGAPAWFDLILVDGGSGRCEAVLSPPGVPEEQAAKLRSLTCLPGEVSYGFNMGSGVGR